MTATLVDPRVSVIIPCFNLGEFLLEAVDSVRNQTLNAHELIVVDDGSTDPQTVRTLAELSAVGIHVLSSTNRGLSAARNLGINRACGNIICCLDADDIMEPGWLAEGLDVLDADPELAFVSHWFDAFGDEAWEWRPTRSDLLQLLDVNTLNSAALVRRNVFEAVGGFDETMRDGCEDWEFWIRVLEAGFRGTILPKVMYRYRRRSDSMSRRMNASDLRFRLFEDLVARHQASYETWLLDLILRREHTFATMMGNVETLRDELDHMPSSLSERRVEESRLKDRLAVADRLAAAEGLRQSYTHLQQTFAGLEDAYHRLERAYEAAERRHADVEGSWSWRLTAPLRSLHNWLGAAVRQRS